MGLQEDVPEDYIDEEIAERRVDRLGQRLTWISILIPVIIGIMIFFAYLDINKKYDHIKNSGAVEVENLSSDLESRFSSLSLKFAKFEETMAAQTAQWQKNLEDVKKSFGSKDQAIESRLKKQLKQLEQAKVSQKDWQDQMTQINQDLKPLGKGMQTLQTQIKKLDQTVKAVRDNLNKTITEYSARLILFEEGIEALNTTSRQLKLDLEDLQSNTRQLSSATVNQGDLTQALRNQRGQQDKQLAALARNVEEQLSALKREIRSLRGRKASAPPAVPATRPSPSQTKPADEPEPAKQDRIIEQDIQ